MWCSAAIPRMVSEEVVVVGVTTGGGGHHGWWRAVVVALSMGRGEEGGRGCHYSSW